MVCAVCTGGDAYFPAFQATAADRRGVAQGIGSLLAAGLCLLAHALYFSDSPKCISQILYIIWTYFSDSLGCIFQIL